MEGMDRAQERDRKQIHRQGQDISGQKADESNTRAAKGNGRAIDRMWLDRVISANK